MAVKIDLSDGEGYFSSQGYSWQSARNSNVIFVLRHILRINNMKEVHNEKNNICNN